MITKLTKKQEVLLPQYRDLGLKIGKRTIKSMDELNKIKTWKYLEFIYKELLNLTPPREVIYAAGPTEAYAILESKMAPGVKKSDFEFYMSQEDIHWSVDSLFYVDNFKKVFSDDFMQKTFRQDWMQFISEVYGVILGDTTAIVVAYPTNYSFDSEGRLHDINKSAVSYLDGTKYYFIDGLNVPAYIVETPIEQVTKKMILGEENVDFRRCLVKRLGGAKTIEILGAQTIDVMDCPVGGRYELLTVELELGGETNRFPYLKMVNQSTGELHIEGVGQGVSKVTEAIQYRNSLKTYIAPEFVS